MIASQRGHLEVVRLFHRPVANPVVPKVKTHYPYSQTFPCNRGGGAGALRDRSSHTEVHKSMQGREVLIKFGV